MIDIAKLAKEPLLKSNYFAPDSYIKGEMEFGLIENRSGSRLLALPELLIQSLYTSLEEEIGTGSGAVLFSCGRWWGKSFYRRFAEEVSNYYGKPLQQMEMIEFLQCLKQCWKAHGWGVFDLDLKYYPQGFMVAKIENSPFLKAIPQGKRPMGFLEAGILSAFFTQLTGQELHCIQTACESMGTGANYFVLGLAERLKDVSVWLEEGHDHDTIMELLLRN